MQPNRHGMIENVGKVVDPNIFYSTTASGHVRKAGEREELPHNPVLLLLLIFVNKLAGLER